MIVFSLSSSPSLDRFILVSNFITWVSNLRILSLGLLYLWFGFPVLLCVGGFQFLVVFVEAWAVVEVAGAFVWIIIIIIFFFFCGRLWLRLRIVGGFGFLVVVMGFLCILLDFLCGCWWC